MLRGMEETCTEAKSSRLIVQMYSSIEMLDERKEQHCFTRGCLLISMTFPGLEKKYRIP